MYNIKVKTEETQYNLKRYVSSQRLNCLGQKKRKHNAIWKDIRICISCDWSSVFELQLHWSALTDKWRLLVSIQTSVSPVGCIWTVVINKIKNFAFYMKYL